MFQVFVFVSVDFFSLQCLDEAFATGIVVGVRRSAHARNHVVVLEEGDIFPASVLQPSIRMMHEAGLRLPVLDGLLQCSDSEPHPEGTIQRPAHHFAREPVQDYRQVDKLRLQPNVGDVRYPKLIDPRQFHPSR